MEVKAKNYPVGHALCAKYALPDKNDDSDNCCQCDDTHNGDFGFLIHRCAQPLFVGYRKDEIKKVAS